MTRKNGRDVVEVWVNYKGDMVTSLSALIYTIRNVLFLLRIIYTGSLSPWKTGSSFGLFFFFTLILHASLITLFLRCIWALPNDVEDDWVLV